MAAPTFVAEYEVAAWNVATSPKTASVTVASGDRLVMFAIAADTSATFGALPTGVTGVTWTLVDSFTTASYTRVQVWTSTAASTPGTYTLSLTGTTPASERWGFNCLRFSGVTAFGTPVKSSGASASPSVAVTTTGTDSTVAAFAGDWNAADGTTRTARTVSGATYTEQTYARDAAWYTVYGGRWDNCGAPGSKTVGWSLPTGQKWASIAIEILGASSGGSYSAAGTVPVVTTTSATVAKQTAVSGTAAAVSAASATVTKRTAVSGTVPVVTTAYGTMGLSYTAIGTAVVVSTVTGAATVQKPASGTVAVVSTASGTVAAQRAVAGSVAVVSTVTGSALTDDAASGTVLVLSSVYGSAGLAQRLAGTVVVLSGAYGSASGGGVLPTIPTRMTLEADGAELTLDAVPAWLWLAADGDMTLEVAG